MALQLCYLCHLNEHPSVKWFTMARFCALSNGALLNACPARGLDHARQLEAEILLLRLRHSPILRHRNLSERYHTQITELTLASIRATQTLTREKYSIADSVGITRAIEAAPRFRALPDFTTANRD
jgi:hypothetical protein